MDRDDLAFARLARQRTSIAGASAPVGLIGLHTLTGMVRFTPSAQLEQARDWRAHRPAVAA